MVWLAGCLLHCNAQRPGAITNATLAEYRAATNYVIGRMTYTTFLVEQHKTGTTGRAKITMNKDLALKMEMYVSKIRPTLEVESDLLFPNREGKQLDHLSRHVKNLAIKLGLGLPNTATETRHAAATAVAGSGPAEQTAVETAMSHSRRTQELYYSLHKGKKDAVEGYRLMETMRREEKGNEGSSLRGSFTASEVSTIKDYFEHHVVSRKAPTIFECREFLDQQGLKTAGLRALQMKSSVILTYTDYFTLCHFRSSIIEAVYRCYDGRCHFWTDLKPSCLVQVENNKLDKPNKVR